MTPFQTVSPDRNYNEPVGMSPRSPLNQTKDAVLKISTGPSTTALSTFLRLLLYGCVESGALFVAWPSSDSHEFEGVALWGPPSDDWLPWCVFRTPPTNPNDPRSGKRKSSYLNCHRRRESG